MVIPRFVRQALAGEPLTVFGTGEQVRCFCHVHDVVPALTALIETDQACGRAVNLGSSEQVSIGELARRVIRAYPYTVAQPRVESLVSRCGYNSGLGAGVCLRCGLYAETVPPRNPLLVRAPVEVNTSTMHWTPATFESIVQTAQHHSGGWIVFLIRDICPAYCTYGITSAQLEQVLAWVHGRLGSRLKVETVHQVIGGPVKPAVAGPAPSRIGGTGVANADLADAPGGSPACFQPAAYGDNRASFSYHPSGGPGGSATETVSLSSVHSGDAKLLQETDLGECAPSVTAGHRYAVGAWYRSTVPTQFDLYYRNQVGVWTYWSSGVTFPATASWKHVSWTTPPAPAWRDRDQLRPGGRQHRAGHNHRL